MPIIETHHTAMLSAPVLDEIRGLMDAAFDGDFGDEDWSHALGGLHVLARVDGELVGHASVVQRQLVVGGHALRTGFVEAVATHPAFQRRGIGAVVMAEVNRIIRGAYELGALSISDVSERLYRRTGWVQWRGPTYALTMDGRVRMADEDGAVFVLPVENGIDLDADITCDFRSGDLW